MEKHAAGHSKDVRRIATSAIDMLMSYHWPGNVRELENCIERAVLVCEGGAIHAHHLPPTLQTAEVSGTLARQSLKEALEAYEKDLVQDALKSARGNRAKAARLLDTTERILGYAVRKHRLDPDRFRRLERGAALPDGPGLRCASDHVGLPLVAAIGGPRRDENRLRSWRALRPP